MNRPSTEGTAGPSGGTLIAATLGGGLLIVGLLALMFGGWFVALGLWLVAAIVVVGFAYRRYRSES